MKRRLSGDASRPAPDRPIRGARSSAAPSRLWERAFAGLAAFAIIAAIALPRLDEAFPPPMAVSPPSVVVLDRRGDLLRAFTDAHGRWRLPVAIGDVDARFVNLLIAYEDQRFRSHDGVDRRAILRAALQGLATGRVVSGASTLTMQTIRLLTDDRRRSPLRKLAEVLRAMQLERRLSKDEILAIYLNAAPYGGNIEGVRAATLAYFGREPARLTLAEAALLIALPQSPETRRPDRYPTTARIARDRVIERLVLSGSITARDAAEAKREPVPMRRRPVPRLAPHLTQALAAGAPDVTVHTTTVERDWQAALEQLAGERVDLIGPDVSAAILVADTTTGEIRASVGNAKFLDERRAGHVDMTRAIRSPGSTLKPLIYGLAMEAGIIAPGTLMKDVPSTFAGYEPDNFDETFQGLITASDALKQSLNVPAVALLEAIGPTRLAVRLQQAGALVELPDTYGPTLAIGLGGFGTRLIDLAELYTALARDGRPVALFSSGAPPPPRARLLAERPARDISHILETMRPPRNARPDEIAYKTGTSYGYRDAWAIGYDGVHVIGVWIGRPDGTPVAELTGWTDAAPLLFDAFSRIGIARRPAPPAEVPTAELPPPLRQFIPRGADGGSSSGPGDDLAIAFPPEGAAIVLSQPDGSLLPMTARVLGRSVDAWLLDGRPVMVKAARRSAQIDVRPGAHTLTVVTSSGASERVNFRVE